VLAAARGRGAEAVLLTSPTALTWLLDGARVHVSLAGPPVAAAVVHPGGVALGVHANEADRLLAEEIGPEVAEGLGLRAQALVWHRPLDPVGAWWPGSATSPPLPEEQLAGPLRAARAALLPAELARYRALCADTAAVATDVLRTATAGEPEAALAARLTAGVAAVGADPLVVLVGGSTRSTVRHPLPTTAPLGDRALVVLCARRAGMIANLSRWVEPLGPVDPARHEAIWQVEADVLDALRPGASFTDLLSTVREAYPRHGFDAAEWSRHHQGGAAGYAGRDPRLGPGVADVVAARQVFAFNPTAPGAKVEDTVLVTAGGVEVLTVDPRWPSRAVRGRDRPAPLVPA